MSEEAKEQSEQKAEKAQTPEVAKEVKKEEAVPLSGAKKKRKSKKHSIIEANVHINATYNNTIITVTELNGNTVAWASAGSCGFKGTRKATPYAASVAAETAMNKAKIFGVEKVHIMTQGTGVGRDQALRAISATGIFIESIGDRTAIPHNGCRARKARRV